MSTTSSLSPTSSSRMTSFKYDVFLSFRGGDTRMNFADHLFDRLCQRGINAFRDENSLKKGIEFGPGILKAIKESRSSIVLLSENYASSPWCLDELVQILDCKNKQGQIVFPVFYKVDPNDVEAQTGNFGASFSTMTEKLDKVNQWRIALMDVCKINGWDLQIYGHESIFCRKIVEDIYNELSIETLIKKLKTDSLEDQQYAACEIRQLAKLSADNRNAIAKAEAIPPLVRLLLSTPDSLTQEHAVTALFNLSICEDNKKMIMSAGAVVPAIIHVLEKGSMEARQNAAATIFSLCVVDDYKGKIGSLGAIPPLVKLLGEGTRMRKKDAAAALFKLCNYHDNKGKAVRAGAVSVLMSLLPELNGTLLEDAIGILGLLASHPEGKTAIGAAAKAVPVLVEVIRNESLKARENAAGILVHLCSGDEIHLIEAYELGVMEPLRYLVEKGNKRAKSKARQLLKYISQLVKQQTKVMHELRFPSQAQLPLPFTTNSADS